MLKSKFKQSDGGDLQEPNFIIQLNCILKQ